MNKIKADYIAIPETCFNRNNRNRVIIMNNSFQCSWLKKTRYRLYSHWIEIHYHLPLISWGLYFKLTSFLFFIVCFFSLKKNKKRRKKPKWYPAQARKFTLFTLIWFNVNMLNHILCSLLKKTVSDFFFLVVFSTY